MPLFSRSDAFIADILRLNAERRPDGTAYVFLGPTLEEQRYLTYLELDRLARVCAEGLADHARRGDRVVLACPSSPEFVAGLFGCFYAGMVAVPVPAPQGSRGSERFAAVVRDCEPAVVLSTAAIVAKEGLKSGSGCRWLAAVTDATVGYPSDYSGGSRGEEIALIQYTSGSTHAPKGVQLSHENLIDNSRRLAYAFGYSTESFCVSWLPPFHDMGLIGAILQPIHGGFPCALMAPATFLGAPVRWLRAVSKYSADVSGGPNFSYDLCMRSVREPEAEGLDLSRWRVAFNGSERVRLQTMEAFSRRFAPMGFNRHAFYPCYGLAESTLIVSGGVAGQRPATKSVDVQALDRGQVLPARSANRQSTLVSCGRVMPQHILHIVDPETLRCCKPGEIGEIWVAGPSVARSYWNGPDATRERLAASLPEYPCTPFLRTGDLGFEDSGELFVTGRVRDLLVMRGANYIPDEIEDTAASAHPALVCGGAVALVSEDRGEDLLVLIAEVQRSAQGLDEALRSMVDSVAARHGLAVDTAVLVRAGSLPRTSSGKVQRRTCRTQYAEQRLHELARWNRARACQVDERGRRESGQSPLSAASYLAELLAWRLNRDVADIDVNCLLSQMGIDSLEEVRMRHALEKWLERPLPLDLLLIDYSINGLAEILQSLATAVEPSATSPARTDDDEASHGERALWYIHQSAPSSSAYNIAAAFRLDRSASKAAVLKGLEAIMDRHPALRSCYRWRDGALRRVVGVSSGQAEESASADWNSEELQNALRVAASAPFDLEAGPLFRAQYFEREDGAVMLLAAHHIIADLWSMGVILRELAEDLSGRATAVGGNEVATYAGYAAWQAQMLAGPEGRGSCEYWQRRLADAPVVDLATDFPRPTLSRCGGAAVPVLLEPNVTANVRRVAAAHGTTPYVVLLAAFQVFLSRYTGSPNVSVGSPFACRTHSAFQDTVGYFANTVVLRADLGQDLSFDAFLEASKQSVHDAFVHQHVPFSLLAETAGAALHGNRNPLVQVFFIFHNRMQGIGYHDSLRRIGSVVIEMIPLERRSSQADLALEMADEGTRLSGALVYDTDLFRGETAQRIVDQFQTLLRGLLAQPQLSISKVPMLSKNERRALVVASTGDRKVRGAATLLESIKCQAASRSDAVALLYNDAMLTYSALLERTEALARGLAGRGIRAEGRVALFMERSIELVVAIVGVLRAGAAYIPLDVNMPVARLDEILRNSDVNVLLTQASLSAILAGRGIPHIVVNDAVLTAPADGVPFGALAGDQLAYIIHTSGSTGTPKGVMNTHAGLANRVLWMQERYCLTDQDRVLQKTPYSFDVSVWEFLWPLATGAALVIARPNLHCSSVYLAQLINEQGVTVVHFVPSMLEAFLHDKPAGSCRSLRLVICSGEALNDRLRQRFQSCMPWAELHNLYGPTEASIDVTEWDCRGATRSGTVPIGRAIHNTEVYVLNRHFETQPVGVPGEIYIGGVGLARGYVNQPALTAQRFGPDCISGRAGARLYRTGDLGRYIEPGTIEFLGRTDQQVKIRGYRIEPGEVEAVLLRHPAVREAVVVVSERPPNDRQMVAYLRGGQASAADLRELAGAHLPEYMIPSAYVWLDALPRTTSGKIDRRALPAPDAGRPDLASPWVAPSTPTESALAEMWSELLGRKEVGVRDTFLEMGGHSILLMQLLARIREQFAVEIPIPLLFEQSINIEMLARYIDDEKISRASTVDLLVALNEVESLTADEIAE